MPDLANNTIEVLNFLVPGFIAAGVYYGFTATSKPNTFERVIQALIFTVVIKAITTAAAVYGPFNNEKCVKGGEKPDQRAEQNTATAAVGVRWSEGVGMRPGAVSAGNEGRA